MANVSVGQPAPDFTLRDENNQEVTLASLRGTPVGRPGRRERLVQC